MEKLLDQEQINAMFRSARGQASSAASQHGPQLVVTNYDLRQPNHLTKEQIRSITSLHEAVCRNLSHSLGAYLRVLFEATVVSVEQLTYAEFLGRIPDVTYLCSLNVAPMHTLAILQLDLQIAFPLIDILLGGQGQAAAELREATEIEKELLEGIVNLISRELDSAWSANGINIAFDERQLPGSVQRLYPPLEKTLVVSFEMKLSQARGMLNLAFPAVVANWLMRKLLRDAPAGLRSGPNSQDAIREVLKQCLFNTTLQTPPLTVTFKDLVNIEEGAVFYLPYRVEEPLTLTAGEQPLFSARVVRTFKNLGAQLISAATELPEKSS